MTVICDHTVSVMKSLSQLSHATIFYMSDSDANDAEVTNATEDRMKKWLIDRGNTILVTHMSYCRGWEDHTIIVIDHGAGLDNMCMRAVSNLSIVKAEE